jgi:HlyD family secretion protein
MDIDLATEVEPDVAPVAAHDRIAEIVMHSEAVIEIMGTPPRWLARWGATVMAGVVLVLLALAWFIHYPDIVRAEIILTTPLPPATVVAQSNGHLESLTVRDGDTVQRGDILARLHSSSDPAAVGQLEAVLAAWRDDGGPSGSVIAALGRLPLGELEGDYAALARAHAAYSWYVGTDPIGAQVSALVAQRGPLAAKIDSLQQQGRLLSQELDLGENAVARVTELLKRKDASIETWDTRQRLVLTSKRELQGNAIDLANARLELSRLDQNLAELSMRDRQQQQDLLVALREAAQTLSSRLSAWERMYVLRAPISGTVSLSHFWTDSQFVKTGDEVMAIVPAEAKSPIGRVSLPIARAGEVQPGQVVYVALDNYPAEQFGLLKGHVVAISPVPLAARYALEVSLSDGLTTTLGQQLTYQQEMQGQAEIVVEDLRVIDRIFYQFRRLARASTGGRSPTDAVAR